jgi:hypothetical protein
MYNHDDNDNKNNTNNVPRNIFTVANDNKFLAWLGFDHMIICEATHKLNCIFCILHFGIQAACLTVCDAL